MRESTLGGVLAVLGEGLNVIADGDAAMETHDLVEGLVLLFKVSRLPLFVCDGITATYISLFPDGLQESLRQLSGRKADETTTNVGQLANLRRKGVHKADEALSLDSLDQRLDVVKHLKRGRLLRTIVEEQDQSSGTQRTALEGGDNLGPGILVQVRELGSGVENLVNCTGGIDAETAIDLVGLLMGIEFSRGDDAEAVQTALEGKEEIGVLGLGYPGNGSVLSSGVLANSDLNSNQPW